MLFLIFSLIFNISTSKDIVDNLKESIFSSSKTSVRVTRTHINPKGEEIFKEYIYKQDDKIRIDTEFGESTFTTFVYNGKTGYIEGKPISKTGSIEIVRYGCACGYLSAMEKISSTYLEGRSVLLATSKQDTRLYLDYDSRLPIRFEAGRKTVEFKDYRKIDGLGKLPFLIKTIGAKGIIETAKITEVKDNVAIPANYFSVPKPRETETLE